jgi:hypothetical protein
MTIPGTEEKQYNRINERMFGQWPIDSSEAPGGLIVHSAGPIPEGWYVYDIWESKEDFQRFGEEQLGPAVREVLGVDIREQEPQFFEIASLLPVAPARSRAF